MESVRNLKHDRGSAAADLDGVDLNSHSLTVWVKGDVTFGYCSSTPIASAGIAGFVRGRSKFERLLATFLPILVKELNRKTRAKLLMRPTKMLRNLMRIAAKLFLLVVVHSVVWGSAFAGDPCVHRNGIGSNGRGFWGRGGEINRTGHGWGLFRKDPPTQQPKRFYDSTGRWTGDGVDEMSTAKPACQPR